MINLNGKIIKDPKGLFSISNRAFKYGDSLFETIRVFEGKMPFLPWHYSRLIEGVRILKINLTANFDFNFFKKEIEKIISGKENCRIRFTLFRNDGGLYTPSENNGQYIIEKTPLSSSRFELNEKGLKIGIKKEKILSHHYFSHLKTGNALPYILAGLEKKEKGYDDILILDQQANIAEAISSNIFIVNKNKIYTPPVTSGCVVGTMRNFLLEKDPLRIKEKNITIKDLRNANSIFLTNAIQGIKWVSHIEEIEYQKSEIINLLVKKINQFIE